MSEDMEKDIITLEFEDGEDVECEIMGIFEVGEKEYIALIPDDDSDDVYIYGYKEADGEEFGEIIDIEDEAEFEAAVKAFDEIMASEEGEGCGCGNEGCGCGSC
ncbi:MAG: DUF1292 domain-containing protein [Eubacteriales bacterium]|nr:DUF1292 domain-containing protein [Eubacteriales bacterium]MDY3333210.1 DUF1292 domain-containing protein [Gallibacter sp.]